MVTNNTLFILFNASVFLIINFFYSSFIDRFGTKKLSNPEVILDFEIARGVFCFFVFIGHSVLAYNQLLNGADWWPPLDKFKTLNHLAATGIDGFFFITGYLFADQLRHNIDPVRFLLRRCLRLLPPLFLATLFITIFYYIDTKDLNFEGFYVWVAPIFSYTDYYNTLIYGHY